MAPFVDLAGGMASGQALLENAIAVARQEKPEIIAGDGVTLLPELLAEVPREAALCIVRVFTNLSPEARKQFQRYAGALRRAKGLVVRLKQKRRPRQRVRPGPGFIPERRGEERGPFGELREPWPVD